MSHAEQRETDRRRWLPATIFAMALCARLAFQAQFVGMRTPPQDDASQYDWIAWSLASGGPYMAADGLRSHRAPGYTFLLAAVYAMFGHSWAAARVAQALLGAATCLVIGRLGSRLFPGSIGWAAALVYAVDPYAIYFCGYLLSEPLCVLLTTASLLALVRAGSQRGWEAAWSCLCALATLTRPNMGLMLPLGLLWLLRRPGSGFRRCGLALAVFCLTLLPWTVRNYSVYGRFVPVTTRGGYNLWLWNNTELYADPWFRHHTVFSIDPLEHERGHGSSEVEVDAAYTRMAFTSIRQHWGEAHPAHPGPRRHLDRPALLGRWTRAGAGRAGDPPGGGVCGVGARQPCERPPGRVISRGGGGPRSCQPCPPSRSGAGGVPTVHFAGWLGGRLASGP